MCNHNTDKRVSQGRLLRKIATKKRQNQAIINNMVVLGHKDKADKIKECATYVRIHTSDDGTREVLESANLCRQRMCLVCAWRRSAKFIATTAPVMKYIAQELQGQDHYIFATFTIRNVGSTDLGYAIDTILSGWRKLARSKDFKSAIMGAIRSLEITYNKQTDTYHPHIHVLMLVKPQYYQSVYYDHKTWSEMWKQSIDANYTPIIDIRAVKDLSTDLAVHKAAIETLKYSVKPSDIAVTPKVTDVLMEALHGRRLISYSGYIAEVRKLLRIQDYENDLTDGVNDLQGHSVLYRFTPAGWEIVAKE